MARLVQSLIARIGSLPPTLRAAQTDPIPATRITEAGDTRVTEAGDTRITEGRRV